jgi:hypothetical protein
MKFEETILSYLDGTLDEHSSAELLHTLSVSPEKRLILEDHLRLRELMSLGHKSVAVPIATERLLASRLSVLATEVPQYVEEAAGVLAGSGMFATATRFVSTMFSMPMVRTAISSAAVAFGVWFFMSQSNGSNVTTNNATSQQHAQLSRASSANQGIQTGALAANQSQVGVQEFATNGLANNKLNASELLASGLSASGVQDNRMRGSSRSSQSSNVLHARSAVHTSIRVKGTRVESANASEPSANNIPSSTNLNVANVRTDDASSDQAQQNVSTDELAFGPIAEVEQMRQTMSAEIADVTAPSRNPLQQYPDMEPVERTPFALRLAVSGVTSFSARLANTPEGPSLFSAMPTVGVDYIVSPRVSLGVEAGQTFFSRMSTKWALTKVPDQQSVYQVSYSSELEQLKTFWTRFMLRYTTWPVDKLGIETDLGVGSAFAGSLAPTFSLGLSANYPVSNRTSLVVGARWSGAWLQSTEPNTNWNTQIATGSTAVGIVSDGSNRRTLFTPAVDAQFGLLIRL